MSLVMTHQQRRSREAQLRPPLTAFGRWLDGVCAAHGVSIQTLAAETGRNRTEFSRARRDPRRPFGRTGLVALLSLPWLTEAERVAGVSAYGADVLREVKR